MQAKGRHILVEVYDCSFNALNDLHLIRTAMLTAAEEMQVTILSDYFHQFSPQGVSGAVVIAESHLTIHTWPEDGYAAVDFFTCGEADPYKGFMTLARELGSATIKVVEMERGFVNAAGGGKHARRTAEFGYSFDPASADVPVACPVANERVISLVG